MDHLPKKYWTVCAGPSRLQMTAKEREGNATGRTLRIDVTRAGLRPSAGLRAMAVRCVRLAMGRFGVRVQKVTVRMAEPANPLGGLDQRCRMRAWLQAAGGVRAEAINGKMEAAVGRAAARLALGVAWALEGDPYPARRRPARMTRPGR